MTVNLQHPFRTNEIQALKCMLAQKELQRKGKGGEGKGGEGRGREGRGRARRRRKRIEEKEYLELLLYRLCRFFTTFFMLLVSARDPS